MADFDTFKELCLAAKEACDTFPSAKQYEPFLLQVLGYVKLHSDDWPAFKLYFIEMLTNPDLGPWELIPFCMRELRWPEVLHATRQRLASASDYRIKRVMEHILTAYEPVWEDANFYAYYSKG